ncbi:hypothetical protein ACH5BF_02175 [Arcobacter sp. YIC-464]|uniref:hypothetical protein n=1 Tax=Arcobacter sp. YIC-464 TaxID=3376631 RepID=UPI003C136272
MEDKNDLSTQRRNLMLMNVLMFLLAITDKDITEFKILNIEFNLNKELQFIESFNDLLVIIWIYFLIRYISSVFYKIMEELEFKKEKDESINFKTSKFFVNLTNKIIQNFTILVFSKDNQNAFPIILTLAILGSFYFNPFTYYTIVILLTTITILQYYNLKVIKKELKEKLENEKRFYNIEVKKQRKIYKLKKEKFLDKRIKK